LNVTLQSLCLLQVSLADYCVFDLIDNLVILAPGCLDSFPKLKAFRERMAARPKIAAYRQSDELKNLPINGNGKQ
jgi:glutathione S-transferase